MYNGGYLQYINNLYSLKDFQKIIIDKEFQIALNFLKTYSSIWEKWVNYIYSVSNNPWNAVSVFLF
jgi:hypothetical protein